MDPQPIAVLWAEGTWRCEYHVGFGGQGRLVVYHGSHLIAAEGTLSGKPAALRGEVLRQRVLRGDILSSESHH